MNDVAGVRRGDQRRALWLSTIAFTVCFAVWTIFSIIGVQIKKDLGLNDTQFGLLVGTPILTGSLIRLMLGIWTDQYGGRIVYVAVMLSAAVATWLLTFAYDYPTFLLAALGVGIAGGSFAVGIAYVSKWYPKESQGTALGIFGAGNVGAAVTKFVAPFIMVAYGWKAVANIWALAIAVMAVVFWLATRDDPQLQARRRSGAKPESLWTMLEPLKNIQVWRFSLYYFFVFGAFVALALWLPRYLIGVYGLDITTAGMIGAAYSVPASLFRIYGGVLSDKYGARRIMYWTFGMSVVCCFILSYPPTEYVVQGIRGPMTFRLETGLFAFTVIVFVLGFFMSLGKAAVYKHIPVYYPQHVGSVGGVVGLVGGLGGFVLPILFGVLNDLTGVWQSCFMALFALSAMALVWMHLAIRAMEKGVYGEELKKLPELPEMQEIHEPKHVGVLGPHLIEDWRPEDKEFWDATRPQDRPAQPADLDPVAAAVVRRVDGVVGRGGQAARDRLHLHHRPAVLAGGAARAVGRDAAGSSTPSWCRSSAAGCGPRSTTWSLIIPALGIGMAVQNPDTPYWLFLALALLCGFGGGNFASSMANISFFFPKAEKGNALALNAGLGNLGVSVVQFVVPLVITAGVFGWLGGEPIMVKEAGRSVPMWLQNAGYVWVPFIIASAFAAWFGMNDLASAKASFAEQSVIFQRQHNWIMCWLYTGTFGSFIGYSAGFPLLAKTQFPEVNALTYAFLGPLVGALSRSLTGWVSDKWGGGRVTFWVFVGMAVGVAGVLYFLGIKSWPGFFAMFLFLFFVSGVGNASTFQMIPRSCARRWTG